MSRVFSNVWSVLSQRNTWLRLLHLLYDTEVMWRKTIKHAFSMFYTLIKHGFLTNQSVHRVLSMLQYIITCCTPVAKSNMGRSNTRYNPLEPHTKGSPYIISHNNLFNAIFYGQGWLNARGLKETAHKAYVPHL